jgi:hypothetical protein
MSGQEEDGPGSSLGVLLNEKEEPVDAVDNQESAGKANRADCQGTS